jgi:hypothetical protein
MDRPGTCIILDKKYNIANSSCHFGSYGSIWTGPSPKKYYMDRSFWGPYNIFLVTDRSIYCHMILSAMNYLLYIKLTKNITTLENKPNVFISLHSELFWYYRLYLLISNEMSFFIKLFPEGMYCCQIYILENISKETQYLLFIGIF